MASLLTIVTVAKDDPTGFQRTLASVNRSDTDDLGAVEWIIVDSSRDQDGLAKLSATSRHKPTFVWVPPEGVYPAMNIGLERAHGEYIYFLNAGEELHDATSLSTITNALTRHAPQWLYGQVAFVDSNGRMETPPPFDYHRERDALFARGRFPPHQGTIVRTELLRELGGFDSSFHIAADYALALRLSLIANPLELQETIANFYTGGLSTTQWRQSLTEFHLARLAVFQPSGFTKAKELVHYAAQFVAKGLHHARRGAGTRRS